MTVRRPCRSSGHQDSVKACPGRVSVPSDRQGWTVQAGAGASSCAGLLAVDEQMAHPTGALVVADPFGHRYVPHVPTDRALARRLGGRPLYIEIGTRLAEPDTRAWPSR
ncbi:hypothetical protein J2W20_000515 [Sinomonas atrocyanea]|nr:hypothetical protein [Sinomonas atrocyanea]